MLLDQEAFHTPWSRALWKHELRSSLSTYLALEADGKLIGYAGFWLVAGEAQITRVAVFSKQRRQGWGKLLLTKLLAAAWQLQAGSVTLEVRRGNEAGLKLYQQCGFRSAGIRPHYYEDDHEDAVIMWLYPEKEVRL